MKIAVVILNWNGQKLLEQFLPSVIQYSPEAVIYVADNASTDHSIAFVKANFPSVQIVKNDSNFGFAQGYNEALKHIDAEIYALVNSDIEVTEHWLQPILENFDNEPKTAIIQPKIVDFKNKEYFEYAGAAGGFIDKFGYPFCRGRIFETIEKDLGQYDDNCEIFWASGACFFIRSSVYKSLNGFDEDFFAHQEEIDLCWRAFNKGYQIKYNSKSVVFHVGGATLQQGNPRKTFLNFRNSLLMLVKNLPKSSLYKILFLRMLLDGLAGIQFLLKGKFSHFLAILEAHYSFYCLFSKNYRKRDSFQSDQYYKTKSIVFTYFIKHGTIFEKLF
ncbi:glycosyltransferase family 2 protein [Flavobacterium psychrotolerans]|uniref:dTDP-Rha--alpha-D-GlcNAc-pyrophosphate polyprenol alpha-3-L-rhamnosyltransferase n=1 Tax=Flavobacterium psychrotolerans TaxID=2169410 RepID=A0A2U1JHZ7_9FLAO|nr:glycosyltransferase family 2 protein [Flavobacterium psychrotolerans]PWA04752.1 dTDP-Rha--alpha-D-GlcNAc-pyrophosphate polyprenol alpha-3-L-rhamnosyltransferase [Flavobacterium psychrotolerans]